MGSAEWRGYRKQPQRLVGQYQKISHIIGVPEVLEKRIVVEKVSEEISNGSNFSNLVKDLGLRV